MQYGIAGQQASDRRHWRLLRNILVHGTGLRVHRNTHASVASFATVITVVMQRFSPTKWRRSDCDNMNRL